MTKNYLRNAWEPKASMKTRELQVGDYVVATKYADGDPGDQFCIGFYNGFFDHFNTRRHLVVDNDGKDFRRGGFRRVARVERERGAWMVRNISLIEQMQDRFSVWHWWRAPWAELKRYAP